MQEGGSLRIRPLGTRDRAEFLEACLFNFSTLPMSASSKFAQVNVNPQWTNDPDAKCTCGGNCVDPDRHGIRCCGSKERCPYNGKDELLELIMRQVNKDASANTKDKKRVKGYQILSFIWNSVTKRGSTPSCARRILNETFPK